METHTKHALGLNLLVVLMAIVGLQTAGLAQRSAAKSAPARPAAGYATFASVPWGTARDAALEQLRHAGYVPAMQGADNPAGLAGSVYGRPAVLVVSFGPTGGLHEIHVLWNLDKDTPDAAEAFKAKLRRDTTQRYGAPKTLSAGPETAVQEYEWPALRLELKYLDTSVVLSYWGLNAEKK